MSIMTSPPAPSAEIKDLGVRAVQLMADGTPADFEAVVHPDAFNHESRNEPAATRGTGPDAWYATARWLRTAFADLHWKIRDVLAEGDRVAVSCTMSGRHVGPFVVFDETGRVQRAFAPTGRTFAVGQAHWLRIEDGRVIEHWAHRDDLGMAEQLGWIPPSPLYLIRCQLATSRARRGGSSPTAG
jgi:predicted ester cyclase